MIFRNNILIFTICFFSNAYSVECTTTETTETTKSTTYNSYLNKQNNKCIYNSYCLPIIIIISTILFFIFLVQCWQYYISVILVDKHSKKNKRVAYVVSNEYNNKKEDNIYSEI